MYYCIKFILCYYYYCGSIVWQLSRSWVQAPLEPHAQWRPLWQAVWVAETHPVNTPIVGLD